MRFSVDGRISAPGPQGAEMQELHRRMATTMKKTSQRQGFKTGEFIVYPAHGVGQITAIEEQNVARAVALSVEGMAADAGTGDGGSDCFSADGGESEGGG